MIEKSQLLGIYDEQLRTEAEMDAGVLSQARLGPFWIGIVPGNRAFVTYRDLGVDRADESDALVARLTAAIAMWPDVDEVEVKTRGHDHAPGFTKALEQHGFRPGERETVVLGPAEGLLGYEPPAGITLRRAETLADVRAACHQADQAFGGEAIAHRMVTELWSRIQLEDDPMQVWLALDGDTVVASGHIDPVPGTDIAGVWGGATLESHRHRGIYRALLSARVGAVMEADGVKWIHSDCTDDSLPILAASGLQPITTTTPYTWRR
ncbi:MAG: GNAT family N-acetyltransferase [Galactobacter sp.]